jgi:hypothetical protein
MIIVGSFFLLPLILASCYLHVDWKNWKSEGDNPLIVDGVEISLQWSTTSYGLVSGGSPYKIFINATGDKNTHNALVVNSLFVMPSGQKKIEVILARNVRQSFKDSEKIAYPKGKHGLSISLKEDVDIPYDMTDTVTVTIDVSVIRNDGKVIQVLVKLKFVKNHYDKWEWVNFLDT